MAFSRRFPRRTLVRGRTPVGMHKYQNGDVVGDFTIEEYLGHSDVNKRNSHIMAKPQHWYGCRCSCGIKERRSQQELIDVRRQQKCVVCRSPLTDTKEIKCSQ